MADMPEPGLIESAAPRVVFAELVAGALERTRVRPTPMATGYLVGLLDERVRPAPLAPGADGAEETLAEALLRARLERGADRIRRLRGLGDRALFAAGFFGDQLRRKLVGLAYYTDAGRVAYSDLAASLAGGRAWSELFEELADRFPDFVEVLTEVGDSARSAAPGGLDPLWAGFLATESPRDRRRLLRRGLSLPEATSRRRQ